tara:strand:- start:303 stop:1064 length:762 start_codon:yes stop_codon:yes gene_type:complete
VQYLYRFVVVRILISLTRYFIFNFFGKFKTLYNPEDKKMSNVTVYETGKTGLSHNLVYRNLPEKFNFKQIKKKLLQFAGKKAELLVYPLKSIDFVNFNKFKVLSIGPRVEAELMTIRSMGFKWKNIKAIDLHSYSSLIELGDMHNIKYENNSFDVIISGWTLRYSTNINLALSEMLRVCKTGGIISIGFTYVKNASIDSNLKTNKTAENELYSTDQIKDFYKNNIRNVYFEFDAYRENPSINRQSIIVLRIKK